MNFEQYIREIEREAVGNNIHNKIYRGHSNKDWLLKTSYARFYRDKNGDDISFSLDEYGYMLSNFVKQMSEYKGYDFDSMPEYQKIALSQHYGIPSPFLDWSVSPYIALYFAVFDSVYRNRKKEGSVCVYSLDISDFDKLGYMYSSEEPGILKSDKKFIFIKTVNYFSRRVRGQQGCFTYINNDMNLKSEPGFAEKIHCYEVSGDLGSILKNLMMMGISSIAMYDEIEYLCKDIVVDVMLKR